jgi:hypothetical protein
MQQAGASAGGLQAGKPLSSDTIASHPEELMKRHRSILYIEFGSREPGVIPSAD